MHISLNVYALISFSSQHAKKRILFKKEKENFFVISKHIYEQSEWLLAQKPAASLAKLLDTEIVYMII